MGITLLDTSLMRTSIFIFVVPLAALPYQTAASFACSPPAMECSEGANFERCVQAYRAARASFEQCRNQTRSIDSAARQADFDRRNEAVKAKKRKLDQADAERRARDNRERLELNRTCGAGSCTRR
jgi:Skp family chaperone for outer membrane proteins